MTAQIMYSQVHLLHSPQMNDTYKLSIWLPPDYQALDQLLPCIYVLDEPEFFGFTSAVALNYWLRETPLPMMIVAIGKQLTSLDDWWSIRWRDFSPIAVPSEPLSGKADYFLRFLADEIVPFIESTYPADSKQRTVWGHSLGGLFSVYTLIRQPSLFRHFIATSPAFVADGIELLPYRNGIPQDVLIEQITSLYISAGDGEPDFMRYVNVFAAKIKQQTHPELQFTYDKLAGLSHMPAALTGFINGMHTIYR